MPRRKLNFWRPWPKAIAVRRSRRKTFYGRFAISIGSERASSDRFHVKGLEAGCRGGALVAWASLEGARRAPRGTPASHATGRLATRGRRHRPECEACWCAPGSAAARRIPPVLPAPRLACLHSSGGLLARNPGRGSWIVNTPPNQRLHLPAAAVVPSRIREIGLRPPQVSRDR